VPKLVYHEDETHYKPAGGDALAVYMKTLGLRISLYSSGDKTAEVERLAKNMTAGVKNRLINV
jgi:hypothetical protein